MNRGKGWQWAHHYHYLANFYVEDRASLKSASPPPPLKYVDDTFVIWPHHGHDKLNEFLMFLKGIHKNIQFTMEVEGPERLPFLDLSMYWRSDENLGIKVYRNTTHTELYLNGASHHHPAQKWLLSLH